MRILAITFLFLSIPFVSGAQVDRTHPPKPQPAPKIELADYQKFELDNGLKVYLVENHKLPRVAFSLFLDHDPVMEKEKAGLVQLTGRILRNGTTSRSKAELDEEIDFIGASLNTSSNGIYGSSLTSHKEKLLELMTDVLMHPSFPQEELDKIKKQTLSDLASGKDDPGAIMSNVRRVLLYGQDHPYGEITTEETVENITLGDLKDYYNTYFRPNIGYLAIVGDINVKEAKKLTEKYFAGWKRGEVPSFTYPLPKVPETTYVALVDRPSSVQSVISVTYPVKLKPGSDDVIKADVMNEILGGGFSSRLMQNLRENKAFTYGARSLLAEDKLIGQFNASASVRNEVTDSAVTEFINELKRIRTEEVTDAELAAAKASMMGDFARSLEQPNTIANFAIRTARFNLPENYYADYLQKMSMTSKEDIKGMAAKYILPDHSNIIIVGKGTDLEEKLKKFGEIKYVDIYGQPVDHTTAAIPEGVTAQTVLDQYIEALGGREKLTNITTMEQHMSADMMGQPIELTKLNKEPRKLLVEVTVNGKVMNRQVVNGEEIAVSQMGNKVTVTEPMKKELQQNVYPFPEMHYSELGVQPELTGIEKIDGKNAYALTISDGEKNTVVHYFDVESGLKIQESRTVQGPQGEMNLATKIGDYKEVEGIKIPYSISQPLGNGMMLNLKMTEVKINQPVEDSKFNQ